MENNLQVFKSDKFDVTNTTNLLLFIFTSSISAFAKNRQGLITALFHNSKFDWNNSDWHLKSFLSKLPDVSAHFFIHNPNFTLVPNAFLIPDVEGDYLGLLGNFPEDSWFFTTPMDSESFHILSFIPAKIKKDIESKFSELTFSHGSSSFLYHLIHERYNQLGEEIIVNCFDSFIYLAGFSDKELVLFNRFEVQVVEDIIKYVLIAAETLKFDKNRFRLTVYGSSDQYELTEEIGNNCFPNFRFKKSRTYQNYTPGFAQNLPKNIMESFW